MAEVRERERERDNARGRADDRKGCECEETTRRSKGV